MKAPDFLSILGGSHGEGIAVEDARRAVTYAELGPAVRRLAGALRERGVSAGDRVAVMLPNSVESVETYLATALLGAIWVGINPAAPRAERDRQYALVEPVLTVTADDRPELAGNVDASVDEPPPELDSPSAIGFTSGTTGTPKAVVHSRAAVSLVAAALAQTQVRPADRMGVILPMSIHNLITVGALPTLLAGATCVAVERMHARGVAAACHQRQLTTLSALVPTTIYDLVHDDSITGDMLNSLRVAGTGAAGLSEDLRGAFETKFGRRLVGSYGMTEAPGVVSIEDPDKPHVPGSCGTPLPHLSVGVRDERDRPLPAHQNGELTVGPADGGRWAGLYRPALGEWTPQGLVRRPKQESVFHTGDHGWIDETGNVYVSGRQSDVIVRGGVSVNAAELESVLGQLPGVRDVAVVGEDDERLGQRIVAFVEMTTGACADADRLREQAHHVLSHGKVPDEFVTAELPRNAMGKVARGGLTRGRSTDAHV